MAVAPDGTLWVTAYGNGKLLKVDPRAQKVVKEYPMPAGPNAGQAWAWERIQNGDTTCANNQVLHGEAADLSAKIAANSHYDAAVADPLDPVTFVDKIKVPVFMACQWEDEQTKNVGSKVGVDVLGTRTSFQRSAQDQSAGLERGLGDAPYVASSRQT